MPPPSTIPAALRKRNRSRKSCDDDSTNRKRPKLDMALYWGSVADTGAILRGKLAGAVYNKDEDRIYIVPEVPENAVKSRTLKAVYGSKAGFPTKMFGDLTFDNFNSPCGMGITGGLIDYRTYPTPMLNEAPKFKLINGSSTEEALVHAVYVG